MESYPRYRDAGVNIAMGTHSYPPDMIRNIDIGVHLAKLVEGRLDAGRAADLYRAATLGGARALGRDDLGKLAPGAKADLIVVDLDDPRVGAVEDRIRTLHMHCTGANVRTVIIDGRDVMVDRRIPGVDEDAIRTRVEAYFAKMKSAYSELDVRRRPTDAIFPPEFPDL